MTVEQYFGTGSGQSESWEWLCMCAGLDSETATAAQVSAHFEAELDAASIDYTGFFEGKEPA